MLAKAAVLCGGEGNRLRPLTNYFQKTMIPVGARRRPILEYVVRLMVHNGVKDVVLLSGYRSSEITNYFDDGSRFGANVRYCADRPGTKGSAPALAHALKTNTVGKFEDLLLSESRLKLLARTPVNAADPELGMLYDPKAVKQLLEQRRAKDQRDRVEAENRGRFLAISRLAT